MAFKRPVNAGNQDLRTDGMGRFRHNQALEARVISDSGVQRMPRRLSRRALLIQRSLHYTSGALVVWVCLFFIAKSMNPPDSALEGGQLAPVLGPYDGVWRGKEVRHSLNGQVLERFDSLRDYWSSSAKVQMLTISRRSPDNAVQNLSMVNLVQDTVPDGPSVLRSRVTDGANTGIVYSGTRVDNAIVWHASTPEAVFTHRMWLTGNELHTEELYLPTANPSSGWQMMGTYKRDAAPAR